MSKYLKNLMVDTLKHRWSGVTEALIVDVSGMEVNSNVTMRQLLREKGIELTVVKNSLARRAAADSALAPAFEGLDGTMAIAWGGEDIVSLAKEIVSLTKDEQFAPFGARGGVMEGRQMSADDVEDVSKWPSRSEQLSILSGQILGPGATLSAQLLGAGAQLASQIKQIGEGSEDT